MSFPAEIRPKRDQKICNIKTSQISFLAENFRKGQMAAHSFSCCDPEKFVKMSYQ
jgi:hypothetical protein